MKVIKILKSVTTELSRNVDWHSERDVETWSNTSYSRILLVTEGSNSVSAKDPHRRRCTVRGQGQPYPFQCLFLTAVFQHYWVFFLQLEYICHYPNANLNYAVFNKQKRRFSEKQKEFWQTCPLEVYSFHPVLWKHLYHAAIHFLKLGQFLSSDV